MKRKLSDAQKVEHKRYRAGEEGLKKEGQEGNERGEDQQQDEMQRKDEANPALAPVSGPIQADAGVAQASRGKNGEEAGFGKGSDTIERAMAYIRSLARQPTMVAGDNDTSEMRSVVLMLSKALYKGPKLGVKAKKKSKAAVCSPVLFLGGVAKPALGPRAVAGGPSQRHTFGCLESYLDVVAECYYGDSIVTAATPHPEQERADLFLQRKSVLGKLSSMWRRRSPIDTWAPLEVALFESSICIHGKGELFSRLWVLFISSPYFSGSFPTPRFLTRARTHTPFSHFCRFRHNQSDHENEIN